MSKEIDSLKSGASSTIKQFSDSLAGLRESTANILRDAGEQLAKSFDKTEAHIEKIGEDVGKIKSKSDKEDATHNTQLIAHKERLERLEDRQDKLFQAGGAGV